MTPQESVPVGAVSFQGEHATLTFQTRLAHPPEAVWQAITDPVELSSWYMTQAVIDGRKGGFVDFRTGAGQLHATGRILQWDPPRVLEYEWKVERSQRMPSGEDAVVRWELKRDGGETVLTLVHRNLSRRSATGAAPYTHVVLERLAAQLDGRPLPDMAQRVLQVQGRYPAREG
jgi:uncharacterized protein YndB with AHSA1/START domain